MINIDQAYEQKRQHIAAMLRLLRAGEDPVMVLDAMYARGYEDRAAHEKANQPGVEAIHCSDCGDVLSTGPGKVRMVRCRSCDMRVWRYGRESMLKVA